MKLRGVEQAAAEAVDKIPPPHLTSPHHPNLSYQQHPAPSSEHTKQAGGGLLTGRGGKGR